jgi:hypothetical protein
MKTIEIENMNNLFNLLRKFITELNSSNSSNDKKLVINKIILSMKTLKIGHGLEKKCYQLVHSNI